MKVLQFGSDYFYLSKQIKIKHLLLYLSKKQNVHNQKWKYYNVAMIISVSNNKSKWSGHYCSCQTNHNDHNQQWKYYTLAVIISKCQRDEDMITFK